MPQAHWSLGRHSRPDGVLCGQRMEGPTQRSAGKEEPTHTSCVSLTPFLTFPELSIQHLETGPRRLD